MAGVEAGEQALVLRFELWERIVTAAGHVALMISATLPLHVLRLTVEAVAGKETVVNANVTVSIVATLSLTVNVVQAIKGIDRRNELKRQRARISTLEQRLGLPSP